MTVHFRTNSYFILFGFGIFQFVLSESLNVLCSLKRLIYLARFFFFFFFFFCDVSLVGICCSCCGCHWSRCAYLPFT